MRNFRLRGVIVFLALYLALLPAAGGLSGGVTTASGFGSPLHQAMHLIGIVHVHSVGGYIYTGPPEARWEAGPSAAVHRGAGGHDSACPLDVPVQFELPVLTALPSIISPPLPTVFLPQAERPPPA
ncbi:MAG: hypothetical protein AAB369_03840 [Chloroflexota bacterium]